MELLTVQQLHDFPSASAIEYHNGLTYLFGDDAAFMVVLDSANNRLDTVHYMTDTAYRVAKLHKDDIEAATAFDYNGQPSIIAFGSMSMASRTSAFIFPLSNPHKIDSFSLLALKTAMKGIREVNVEGAVVVDSQLVFANRANASNPVNQLVIVDNTRTIASNPRASAIALELSPVQAQLGISGIHYVTEEDRMVFTLSEEQTADAVSDGAIGNSYLGWISHFKKKKGQRTLRPDRLLPLAEVDPVFVRQKIEAVCVTKLVRNGMLITLASDNDNGQSTLFKVRVTY